MAARPGGPCGKRGKVTPEMDVAIIRNHGRAPQKDIAAELGISVPTLRSRVEALGLRDMDMHDVDAPAYKYERSREEPVKLASELAAEVLKERPPAIAEDAGRLERLTQLRNLLHIALMEATPGQLPKLSAEYRATLEEIDALTSGEGGAHGGKSDLEIAVAAIAAKVASA